MQLETSFKDTPGSVVFSIYQDFYEKHIEEVCNNLETINFVELGCDLGLSGRMFIEMLDAIGKPYTIRFVDINYRVEMVPIIDSSTTFFIHSSAEDAVSVFGDGSIDILHIDIDPHEAEFTKKIFELYRNKLAPKGIMLFHDASPIQFTVWNFIALELQPISGWQSTFCDERQPIPQAAPAMVKRL